jgi:hypothetical protein
MRIKRSFPQTWRCAGPLESRFLVTLKEIASGGEAVVAFTAQAPVGLEMSTSLTRRSLPIPWTLVACRPGMYAHGERRDRDGVARWDFAEGFGAYCSGALGSKVRTRGITSCLSLRCLIAQPPRVGVCRRYLRL